MYPGAGIVVWFGMEGKGFPAKGNPGREVV
jgi:hypothetical protein